MVCREWGGNRKKKNTRLELCKNAADEGRLKNNIFVVGYGYEWKMGKGE